MKLHSRKLVYGKRKGNLKKETESLLIAAENNAITTNYIKAKIDNTQQNNKCSSYENDEAVNDKQTQ